MVVLDPKVKKVLTYAGIGVLVILAIFLIVSRSDILHRRSSIGSITSTPSPTPSPSPSPTPTPLPIAPGRQVYTIQSDGKSPGPAITEATFDPLDVSKGGMITVSVKAKDAASVSVTMIDDSGKNPHTLSLSNNVWSGVWTAESTHNRVYGATIEAVNSKGEKRLVELWFR
ncbi:MAG: hypothetical protein Q8L37_05575 [Candidatus Gottesmanbacteria bacterium]|nr:hypothetical protein [Candidatus Gottesmanbacteria bacterium]